MKNGGEVDGPIDGLSEREIVWHCAMICYGGFCNSDVASSRVSVSNNDMSLPLPQQIEWAQLELVAHQSAVEPMVRFSEIKARIGEKDPGEVVKVNPTASNVIGKSLLGALESDLQGKSPTV